MPYVGYPLNSFFLTCQMAPTQPTIGLRQAGQLSECSYATKQARKKKTKALKQQMT